MNTPTHEFVTADMLGLKAALVARARVERVSVSAVVRRAVERELGVGDAPHEAGDMPGLSVPADAMVKLSLRLTLAEARLLAAESRRAGLSRGAFLSGLLTGVASLSGGSLGRPDCLAALHASSAELSTLSRNLHHLTALLRHGQVRAALEYRQVLDTLVDDVRSHLRLASGVLADLQPARRVPATTGRRKSVQRSV